MVYDWIKDIQAFVYPPTCVLCGGAGGDGLDLCPGCRAELPRNRHCCPRCALPLPAGASPQDLCGECTARPPPFDHCHAPLLYAGMVPHLVAGLKFNGRLNYGRLLSRCLIATLVQQGPRRLPRVIVPVPLHRSRLRERGYNQALEIARPLSRKLGIPLVAGSLVRRTATAPQTSLERQARRRNVRGAFQVVQIPPDRHVAILDDVITTGSTVAELARVLKRAGIERVDVWAVARTP